MKLKLCGIRRPEDIAYVNAFPPDYIGFVFAQSRRRVTAEEAARLTARLRTGIRTVGVFVNEPIENLLCIVKEAGLAVLQLHGDEDAAYVRALRKHTSLPIWKAVRVSCTRDIREAESLPVDALLLDAFTPDAYGGTGKTADWRTIRGAKPKLPFFLAGGLNSGNLAEAVSQTQPQGVDISGGIETDGCKNRAKIEEITRIFRSLS